MNQKLACKLYGFLYSFYYRVVFGREMPFANHLAQIVRAWELRRETGDIPVSGNLWESQYLSGRWKYMRHLDELARYSVIVGYIEHLKPAGAILDVGCGEGILFRKLLSYGYSRYFGIDISGVALATLAQYRDGKNSFLQVDAESYLPDESFDVIVFNETLYYFHNPLRAVERYARSLRKEGVLIVETYVASTRAMSILKRLKANYALVDETRTIHESSSKSWICSVFSTSCKDKATSAVLGDSSNR
jgi:SAM-dependent methyltransferase